MKTLVAALFLTTLLAGCGGPDDSEAGEPGMTSDSMRMQEPTTRPPADSQMMRDTSSMRQDTTTGR